MSSRCLLGHPTFNHCMFKQTRPKGGGGVMLHSSYTGVTFFVVKLESVISSWSCSGWGRNTQVQSSRTSIFPIFRKRHVETHCFSMCSLLHFQCYYIDCVKPLKQLWKWKSIQYLQSKTVFCKLTFGIPKFLLQANLVLPFWATQRIQRNILLSFKSKLE